MKGGVSRPSRLVDSAACPGSTASSAARRRRADRRAGAQRRSRPRSRTSPRAFPRSPRPCCPAPRRSCATPRRSAAICCSARAAPISTTPPAPATSASPARAATRAAATTALHAVLGGARPASPPTPRISAWRWSRSTPWWRSKARAGRREIALEALHRLPGDAPERETVLEPGELIIAVRLPAAARALRGPCALSQGARPHLLRLRPRLGGGGAAARGRHDRARRGSRSAASRRSRGARARRKRRWPAQRPDADAFRRAAAGGAGRRQTRPATTASRSNSRAASSRARWRSPRRARRRAARAARLAFRPFRSAPR